MSDSPKYVLPCYRLSLTQEQATELGRLTLVWGQLDHFILMAVTKLVAADQTAGMIIMKEMTTGTLLGLLRKSLHRIEHEEMQKLASKFVKDMNKPIELRNHIVHGMWGFLIQGKSAKTARPACLYLKTPQRQMFPERITEVANTAAELTHDISKIVRYLYNMPEPAGEQAQFFFTTTDLDKLEMPQGLGLQPL